MGEELECYNLEIPTSRNEQIWSRKDLGLERDRFYAAFYAIEKLQRQQQAETKVDPETSVENLFLDRLALLFARIKTNSKKTPANVTATCLVRRTGSRWNVFIAKNGGLQESEKSFAKKLQDWIQEEANNEGEESVKSFGSGTEHMAIEMANFWKDRIKYYVKGSKVAWNSINQSKTIVERYFQTQDQKFTKKRFDQDWAEAEKLARYLLDERAVTMEFLTKFYDFWNRKDREDWHKPPEPKDAKPQAFRKCIRYMQMLGMPISTWKACVRFQRLAKDKTVHLIAINKPTFDESKLDKQSIMRVFQWWKTKHSIVKDRLEPVMRQLTGREPELFFHCELQILTLLMLKYPKRGHHFIGCSKLSCESCWQILKNVENFTTRGSHRKVSANCAFPFPESLTSIGKSMRLMQSAWKETILSDSIHGNVQIDDTDQAATRRNAVAEEFPLDLPVYSSDTTPYTTNASVKPGKGSFTSVFLATKRDHISENSDSPFGVSYALKVTNMTSTEKFKMVENEIAVLRRLQNDLHPNVLRLEKAFYLENPRTVVLATQPYAPLSLEKLFERILLYDPEKWYDPDHLSLWPEIIRQCLEGLNFLHTREPKILHGDLKPQNILLWKPWKPHETQDLDRPIEIRVIITDFGISTGSPVEDSIQQGTLEYMSPEILEGASKTILSDMWALGCCFAQIFVLLHLGERSLAVLRKTICNPERKGFSKNLDKVNSMLHRADGKQYSDKMLESFVEFRKTVSEMLHESQDQRPTTQIALEFYQEREMHLQITKLNISGLTICFTLGLRKYTHRFTGPNLPNMEELIDYCRHAFSDQRSAISRDTGAWWPVTYLLSPSTPRLVYLTMPKDQKTNVTHIESDFPGTHSRKTSKPQNIDSTQPQLEPQHLMQISTDQDSVNGALRKSWEVKDDTQPPWAYSLDVFEKISRLSHAWGNTARSSSPSTIDRECGLEIKYSCEKENMSNNNVLFEISTSAIC
ncbi:hypothetical protein MMC07_008524 [Pseudocyphellaria aurata]|nr:hypothetical protein [Pseudocyphellaria aurata]